MERDLNCLRPTSMASIFAPACRARVYYTELEDGVATQFPESQFYPNPIINFKFYRRIPI